MPKLTWALVVWLGSTAPASAHKLTVFATVQGDRIVGEAFFRGGGPARGAVATLLGPGGERLDETTTSDEGKFEFTARRRADCRLVVTAGEGHAGEFSLRAEDFSSDLPAANGSASHDAQPGALLEETRPLVPSPSDAAAARGSAGLAELASRVESVDRQLARLREELARYEDKVRLHDILGGIGCILGFMGLSFYFLGVRRKERLSPPSDA